METTSSKNKNKESLVLSVWPNCQHLSTIDPACLAASLWLRAQGITFSIENVNHQTTLLLGNYPSLRDTMKKKRYIGFESIYEYSRTLSPTADELALLATFKRLFIPAFMHSQWLDESNRASFRTLYHFVIGLPTSLFHIRKKFSVAQTWLDILSSKSVYSNEQDDIIYTDAARCLSMLEDRLVQNKDQFICGEKFSLIDAWVSSYLLVLVHYGSEKSRLRVLLANYTQLDNYVQRINQEQRLLSQKRDNQPPASTFSKENQLDIVSVLHFVSQMVSFSIFVFMLTKIGADSYGITS